MANSTLSGETENIFSKIMKNVNVPFYCFNHVDVRDCIQVARVGGKYINPLTHLSGSKWTFLERMTFIKTNKQTKNVTMDVKKRQILDTVNKARIPRDPAISLMGIHP